jgi:hypothetical protein
MQHPEPVSIEDYRRWGSPLNSLCGISVNATNTRRHYINVYIDIDSQFPLWDFGECNTKKTIRRGRRGAGSSQFPLWDFGECNLQSTITRIRNWLKDSQFPLWDFGECNRCRFGCFSGNWRGKSAGHTAYPAPVTGFIKIRRLFKFFAARLFQPFS